MRRALLATLALAFLAPLALPKHADARVGARPPEFSLPGVPGSSGGFDMGDHLGRNPVVIIFWATWCDPCKQQMPVYQALYERLHEDGLQVVAISMDGPESIPQTTGVVRRLGLTYPVVSDLDTAVSSRLNPRRGAPFTVWIDRSGRIVHEREGFTLAERRDIARGVSALVRRGR
ncbi:MAG: TlpA disulfide reductase family protein [Myxococcota bacterium]